MMEKIIFARWVIIGVDANGEVIIRENEGLAYRVNKILEIGELSALQKKFPEATVNVYPEHIIIPGLVNSHHHLGLTPLQLGAPDYALELWFAARLAMRKIDPYLDTLFSALEMISSGVTSVQHIQGW